MLLKSFLIPYVSVLTSKQTASGDFMAKPLKSKGFSGCESYLTQASTWQIRRDLFSPCSLYVLFLGDLLFCLPCALHTGKNML